MSDSKTRYSDLEIDKNTSETPSFVIESREPRVLLSATLGGVLGSGCMAELVTGNVLDNNVDPDGSQPSASTAVGPAHGTLILDEDGSFAYVPDDGFSGVDRFWYQVDHGNGYVEQIEVCVSVDALANDVAPATQVDQIHIVYDEVETSKALDNDFDRHRESLRANQATH